MARPLTYLRLISVTSMSEIFVGAHPVWLWLMVRTRWFLPSFASLSLHFLRHPFKQLMITWTFNCHQPFFAVQISPVVDGFYQVVSSLWTTAGSIRRTKKLYLKCPSCQLTRQHQKFFEEITPQLGFEPRPAGRVELMLPLFSAAPHLLSNVKETKFQVWLKKVS